MAEPAYLLMPAQGVLHEGAAGEGLVDLQGSSSGVGKHAMGSLSLQTLHHTVSAQTIPLSANEQPLGQRHMAKHEGVLGAPTEHAAFSLQPLLTTVWAQRIKASGKVGVALHPTVRHRAVRSLRLQCPELCMPRPHLPYCSSLETVLHLPAPECLRPCGVPGRTGPPRLPDRAAGARW